MSTNRLLEQVLTFEYPGEGKKVFLQTLKKYMK